MSESASSLIHITDKNQFKTIIKQFKSICILFTAEWCEPCKIIEDTLKTLSCDQKYSIIKYLIIDVDILDDLASEYIETPYVLPTVLGMISEKIVNKCENYDENDLKAFLNKLF